MEKLESNPLFLKCNYVIIENQPVLKIYYEIYSNYALFYFLIKNKKMERILLVNASNKLKVYKDKLDDESINKINSIKDNMKK